ncbi:hypothetical protein SLA2020_526740 [Shorea laevis]
MCPSKPKLLNPTNVIAEIIGRPVLQPTSNPAPNFKNKSAKPPTSPVSKCMTMPSFSPPISPKLKSLKLVGPKRAKHPNEPSSSSEKISTPCSTVKLASVVKKPKSSSIEALGSIAAARRKQIAIMQVERKMGIVHCGRTKSAKLEKMVMELDTTAKSRANVKEKRCSLITDNSDPIYVAYHDEEWGVPIHDDKMLFELLVLTGAQVGSDWTSVLKKRQAFREAFSGFDAEIVAKYSEKKMTSISAEYGIDVRQVRGAVDNANRILEVKEAFGSLDKYLWGFVNHRPIVNQYKSWYKILAKSSKSEFISKDMVRRGFRFVGPTVIHSLMQAAGLTNDHLLTCPRHIQCVAFAK